MCVSIISATNFIEKAKKQSIKVLPEIYRKFCRAENENILANTSATPQCPTRCTQGINLMILRSLVLDLSHSKDFQKKNLKIQKKKNKKKKKIQIHRDLYLSNFQQMHLWCKFENHTLPHSQVVTFTNLDVHPTLPSG